ncbi:MAG TPA: D-alanyl-D-alanine carboxypeptidase family protein [Blastocatellia bacterium]|nr:D-alanyl-D-alanine carboxypeptidase family protein [Blastocatellia bacterium]
MYRANSGASLAPEARLENVALQESLQWTFGGKPQRGWQLYWPLIAHCVGFEGHPDNPAHEDFAAALLRWQQSVHLPASGILDEDAWMKMVEHWQTRRSKDRRIPHAEKLVTVSATEFYDPERPAELRQVERETYAAYQRMVRAAAQDLDLMTETDGSLAASEQYLKIISAFRSPEYQQKLRVQSPHSGRAGLAVNSPHFTGRALDLYVGGEPVSTKDANRKLQTNTKAYRWLVKNAGKFGFIPYFYEPWHWEYNPSAAKP